MADSKLFEKVLNKVEECYGPGLPRDPISRGIYRQAKDDMKILNEELLNDTSKVSYLRLFKLGKAILGIRNFNQ